MPATPAIDDASTVRIKHGRRSYLVLADVLRDEILSGALSVGTMLPTERELGLLHGLSRGSVREALRMLEVEGLISTRPGRNGGSVVRRPEAAVLRRALVTFARGQHLTADTILEVREVIEPAAAALAALHHEEEDLAALDAATMAMRHAGSEEERRAADTSWHVALIRACRNPILRSLIGGLDELTDVPAGRIISDDLVDAEVHAHEQIEDAIRKGDPDTARRRTARHLVEARRQTHGGRRHGG